MTPIIFINSSEAPYVKLIMNGEKRYETRSRQTLDTIAHQWVLIAETGKRKTTVKALAWLGGSIAVSSREEWNWFRSSTCVPSGSRYDWKNDTSAKYLYEISNVYPLQTPFPVPADCKRHGRTWAEFTCFSQKDIVNLLKTR